MSIETTIVEQLDSLNNIKNDIATAIENKGVTVEETTTFSEYADKIAQISVGGIVYNVATADSDGLMSASDKKKLDTNVVTLDGTQTITGVKTFNAPTNVASTEQATVWFNTANGGRIGFGKESANSGTGIFFDQVSGTRRLNFRASATAGAMVWEQPEEGAALYVDLGAKDSDYHRITFPSSAGTLALTSQITKSQVGLSNVANVLQYSASNPNFGTATPLMDGTGAVGTATTYARSDHRHPTDTSRASTAVATTESNGLMSSADKSKLDGIAASADSILLNNKLYKGTPIAELIINNLVRTLYAPGPADGWLPTTVYESEFSDIVFGDGVSRSGYIYATQETRGDKTRFTIDLTTTNAESISSSAIKMALLSTVGYKWRREYNLTALIVELLSDSVEIMRQLYVALADTGVKYMEVVEHSWKWTTTLSTTSVTNMLNGNGTTYAVPAYSSRENSTLPAFWVWIDAVELDDYNTDSLTIDGAHIKVRLY